MRYLLRTTFIILLVLYAILIALYEHHPAIDASLVFHLIVALSGAGVFFLLPGVCSTVLIRHLFKQNFNQSEFWTIAVALSLILPTLLIAVEALVLHDISPWLVILNSATLLLITSCFGNYKSPAIKMPGTSFRNILAQLWRSPLVWASVIYTSLILLLTLAYEALPDLDPYTWLNLYVGFFKSHINTVPDRFLFYYFLWGFDKAALVNPYWILKAVIPILGLVVLVPLHLVATQFKAKSTRLLIYLSPLLAPSTILYLFLPIPQTLAIILTLIFICLLLHAYFSERILFHYLAGVVIFSAFFFHETGIILFVIWLVVTLFQKRHHWLRQIRHSPTSAILLVLLIASNLERPWMPTTFLLRWFHYFIDNFSMRSNWAFPTSYRNIDGVLMGWSGIMGVTKYYLYYIGPPLLVLIPAVLAALILFKSIRQRLLRKMFANVSLTVLVACLTLFFLISEILPRVSNIALLPERSWVFTSLLAVGILTIILEQYSHRATLIPVGLLMLTGVSLGGALYINALKRFVISNGQIRAASWIASQLPRSRVFFVKGNTNLLTIHAQSDIISLPPSFYCDAQFVKNFDIKDLVWHIPQKRHVLSNNPDIAFTPHLGGSYDTSAVSKRPWYIFFTPAQALNPYRNRPYETIGGPDPCPVPVFDAYPAQFKKIYEDRGQASIWQVLE